MAHLAIIFTIAIALAFDYVNGFHDAANSIATVVSTRVLSPRLAVIWAAFFNFVAFLVFGTAAEIFLQVLQTFGNLKQIPAMALIQGPLQTANLCNKGFLHCG